MLRISFILLCSAVFLFSCKEKKSIGEKQIVQQPAQIDESATEIIQGTINDFLQGTNPRANFLSPNSIQHIKAFYKENNFLPLWSNDGSWTKYGDSLYSMICNSAYYGLFPEDYHYARITELRNTLAPDTAAKENKLDAALWAETDLYLSNAFIQIIKDLKIGRIKDSTALKKDSALRSDFMLQQLKEFQSAEDVNSFAKKIEPSHNGYHQLRSALSFFLPKADFRKYTYVSLKDSVHLRSALLQRLIEDSIEVDSSLADTVTLVAAIKKYQKRNNLKQDGKISQDLINRLNETDTEKFIRVAITLDRYKQLPDSLPAKYILVNIPSYYLQVRENDTVRLKSKIVVGKSYTQTPVLTSAITDMITYPQWTIPESIIRNEILPGLKKNPSYTLKKGYSLINNKGEVVDPIFIDWSKYKTGIPYRVVQGSGDDNALGVIKFNFSNKYSVYLHDTNQRYLFSRKNRALSHGCVRVQNWDSLAYFILRNDSMMGYKSVSVDTLKRWLALKQKHVIPVKKRIPLYIRYFSCEGDANGIVFHDDIYGDDRRLKERYFANKNLNL